MKYIFYGLLIFCAAQFAHANINAEIFKTKNNMDVIFVQDKTTDLISVYIAFANAGSISDPTGKEGLSTKSIEMLFRSDANSMDRFEKSIATRNLGILYGINYTVTTDHVIFNFKCPIENFTKALKLIHNLLFKVDLNISELNKLKEYHSATSNLGTANEISFAWQSLVANIFMGHPYAIPTYGLQNSIQSFTIDDIKQTLNNNLAKDNILISIVGNSSKNKLKTLLDQTFADLPQHANLPSIPTPSLTLSGEINVIVKEGNQSGVVFAQSAPQKDSPDYYPMLILNRILGQEPFNSRLWLEIRENRGLVYDIGTSIDSNFKKMNLLIGWFNAENQHLKQIITLIRQQWNNIKEHGVSQAEFSDAVTGLIGEHALQFITPEQIANYLLQNRLDGFSLADIQNRNSNIKNVTLDMVNNVAKKYLNPEELTFVIVGNP